MTLTHLSLFSGIGGIDLAAEWAGFTTVGQCEMADYPTRVLEKHWPDVPRWRDVRDVTAESVRDAGVGAIDLVSGGYPCQPFSFSGKREGESDDRYLWPEMFRVIEEVRPNWVVGENVAGHITLGLDKTLADMEGCGYACRTFVLPAAAVGAVHARNRTFVVAHSEGHRLQTRNLSKAARGADGRHPANNFQPVGLYQPLSDPHGQRKLQPQGRFKELRRRHCDGSWWQSEPDVVRVVYGVPNGVDRVRALGNAVVPAQVYPILQAIADIENGLVPIEEATP